MADTGMARVPHPPRDRVILDVLDGRASAGIVRRGALLNPPASAFPANTSTTAARDPDGFEGWRATSAAAQLQGRRADWFVWPLGRDWSAAPAAARHFMRYRAELRLARTALLAGVPCHFGIKAMASPYALNGHASITGHELVSDPAVNGGRWTVREKLAGGTTNTTGELDTGIDGLAPVFAVFELVEGLVPVLTLRLDGELVRTWRGAAELAVPNGSSDAFVPMFGAGGAASVVGAVDYFTAGRLTVEEL